MPDYLQGQYEHPLTPSRPADDVGWATLRPANAALFKDWLRLTGWTQRSEGPLGELFQYQGSLVAIPREVWRDPHLARGVAARVAQATDRSLAEVLKRLIAPMTDRIELRLRGESLGSGRVPLGAASEALRNGRRMLSASGTSAVSPSWSVARRYRPEAQELARDAELAHTEEGSFIFPLYITLDRSDEPPLTYEAGSVVPESYERRVTRTLATALATTVRLVDGRIDNLEDDELDEASSVGVSRELCVSLDELLKSPAVQELEVDFEWSPAFGATVTLPSHVGVVRELRPKLRALANRLARPEPISTEVYSGQILEIGRGPEDQQDEGYHLLLDTYFRERKSKLTVQLSQEQHERAIFWYRDRSTVIVRGTAQQLKSGLLMTRPERMDAWGTMRL